jgi:hypothetical protein
MAAGYTTVGPVNPASDVMPGQSNTIRAGEFTSEHRCLPGRPTFHRDRDDSLRASTRSGAHGSWRTARHTSRSLPVRRATHTNPPPGIRRCPASFLERDEIAARPDRPLHNPRMDALPNTAALARVSGGESPLRGDAFAAVPTPYFGRNTGAAPRDDIRGTGNSVHPASRGAERTRPRGASPRSRSRWGTSSTLAARSHRSVGSRHR